MAKSFWMRANRCIALLGFATAFGASAQTAASTAASTAPASSRISEVRLYPGGATVERVTRVSAGARSVTFSCLPVSLSLDSLQVTADSGVRIGDVTAQQGVRTNDTSSSRNCPPPSSDADRLSLNRRKATVKAEIDALDLVTGYLKGLPGASTGPVTPQGIVQQAEALKKTALESELRRAQLREEMADIDRLLEGLQLQRRDTDANQRVQNITVSVAASQSAEVRIKYSVQAPGWVPSYRIQLDTSTGMLRFERMAELQQATGEDWNGVKLVLSTTRPRANAVLPRPRPWNLRVVPPATPAPPMPVMAAPMAAPAPMMARQSAAEDRFDVSILEGAHEMEFVVPHAADIPSGGQRMTLALGTTQLQGRMVTRTTPLLDATAYLVADLPQPSGLWPAGVARLMRDGTYTGSTTLRVGGTLPLSLPFGIDERVRVEVKNSSDSRGTGGFVGSRQERRISREYLVVSGRDKPIALEVLEGSPVTKDDQIKVEKTFSPTPDVTDWQNQQGAVLWAKSLGPNESATFKADYVISYPKDVQVTD